MPATDDLFTPIHKAIRSMIYSLGGRLQSNDFADLASSKTLLDDLEHEFSSAVTAGCILCLLHHHAADEETTVFPDVAGFDEALVRRFIEDHHELTGRLATITRLSHEVAAQPDAMDRVRAGVALNQVANEFFAAYIDHMNREETQLVPMMREKFTNEQMGAMRGAIMGRMSPDRIAAWFRWMLPSLTMTELTGLVRGVKASTPPAAFEGVAALARRSLPPERWELLKERVGI